MTQGYTTPIPCIYGEGAPTLTADNGARYIDTVTGIEYVRYGGAWNKTGTGTGGGGGLPYVSNTIGPYTYWYVYGPYGLYLENNSGSKLSLNGYYADLNSQNLTSVRSNGDLHLYSGSGTVKLTANVLTLNALPNAPGASGTLWADAGAANVVKVAP